VRDDGRPDDLLKLAGQVAVSSIPELVAKPRGVDDIGEEQHRAHRLELGTDDDTAASSCPADRWSRAKQRADAVSVREHSEVVEAGRGRVGEVGRPVTLTPSEQDRREVQLGPGPLGLGPQPAGDGDRPIQGRDRGVFVTDKIARHAEHAGDEGDDAGRENSAAAVHLGEQIPCSRQVGWSPLAAGDLDDRRRPPFGSDGGRPRESHQRRTAHGKWPFEGVDIATEQGDADLLPSVCGLRPRVERVPGRGVSAARDVRGGKRGQEQSRGPVVAREPLDQQRLLGVALGLVEVAARHRDVGERG